MKWLKKNLMRVALCLGLSMGAVVPSSGQTLSDLLEFLSMLGIDVKGTTKVYDETQTYQSISDAANALSQAKTTFDKLKEVKGHLDDYSQWLNNIYTQVGNYGSAITKIVRDVREWKMLYLRFTTYLSAVQRYHKCLDNWEASGSVGQMGRNLLNVLNTERSFLLTGTTLVKQTIDKVLKDFTVPGLDGAALIQRIEKTDDEVKDNFKDLYEHMYATASQVEYSWMVESVPQCVDLPVEGLLGGRSAEDYADDAKTAQKYSVGIFTVILLIFGVLLAGYGVVILMRQTTYDPLANTMYWIRLGVGLVVGALLISIL